MVFAEYADSVVPGGAGPVPDVRARLDGGIRAHGWLDGSPASAFASARASSTRSAAAFKL